MEGETIRFIPLDHCGDFMTGYGKPNTEYRRLLTVVKEIGN